MSQHVPQALSSRLSPSLSTGAASNFTENCPQKLRMGFQFSSRKRHENSDEDLLPESQVAAQRVKKNFADRDLKKRFGFNAVFKAARRGRSSSDDRHRGSPSSPRRPWGRTSRRQEDEDALLRIQVEAMQETLQASTHTADALRKRLCMISCYYENIIRSLQDNIVALKVERNQIEVDLTNQVLRIHREKRAEIKRLEIALEKESRGNAHDILRPVPKMGQRRSNRVTWSVPLEIPMTKNPNV
jgi:hypothetical protein